MYLGFVRSSMIAALVGLGFACDGDVNGKPSTDGGGARDTVAFQDGEATVRDTSCGGAALPITATQPNLLIVFDRSCSMRRLFDDPTTFGTGPSDPATRWYVAREAVSKLAQRFGTRIRFGMLVYPRPRLGCGDVPGSVVGCDLLTQQSMLDALDAPDVTPFDLCDNPQGDPNYQPHETPTDEALRGALADPAMADTSRARNVLLITDGYATCGATAGSLGLTTAQLAAAGIKTAVVGFGDVDRPEAIQMLDAIATAGELPRANGTHKFWLATDPAGLSTALETIAADAVSCRFKLQQSPPDDDKLYVYADGVTLEREGVDGWSYDPAQETITLQGSSCAQLKAGETKQLSVVYGCPDPACQPTSEVCDGLDNDCNGLVDDGCLK